MWEHYLFTSDKEYLEKVYPAMKGAAQFFLDTLVEEPDAQMAGHLPVFIAGKPASPGRQRLRRPDHG